MRKSRNKGKKFVSLNRILTLTVIIAYIVFLLLLLWMDSILVINYQKERKNEERQQVSDYADTLNEHLDRIEEFLYDVYAYNADFEALSGSQTELEEFDSAYEVGFILRNRVSLYQWINGYMLNYHRGEKWSYYFEGGEIGSDQVDEIKEVVGGLIREGENWERLIAQIDGQTYCFISCSKENASVCGAYDLRNSIGSYAKDLESKGDVFFVANDQVYGIEEEVSIDVAKEILIQTNEEAVSFEKKIAGNEYFGKRVGGTGFWVIYKSPITIFTFMNAIHMFLFLLTFSTLVIAWFVYKYIRKNIFMPLRSLTDTMNEVSKGNWDSAYDCDSRLEEIRRVNEAFRVMVSEIKRQKILSYTQTIEKQKAQMQYLQLQLKPHFYLNGLKTLNMLAIEGDAEKAQDLIMHLSYHLRYLLQVNRTLVPLSSEIDYTKNYGEIQAEMYGNKITMNWDVQENLENVPVPTLCIQTFVENSFKYALSDADAKKVEITVKICELETQEGKFIDISVRDNGVGYPENILEEINGDSKEKSVSVGINNLKRRCLYIYGGRGEYNFYNNDGAVSEIVLPCDRGMDL